MLHDLICKTDFASIRFRASKNLNKIDVSVKISGQMKWFSFPMKEFLDWVDNVKTEADKRQTTKFSI